MSEQPNTIEPVPVQLTRIEGTINLIAYQMTEVKTEVAHLGRRVTQVELTQAQSTGSSATWKTWLPMIIAASTLITGIVIAIVGS